MEPIANFLDEEWESLTRLLFSTEEADFKLHLHGGGGNGGGDGLFLAQSAATDGGFSCEIMPPTFFLPESANQINNVAEFDESSFFSSSSDTASLNTNIISQGSSNSSENETNFTVPDQGNYDFLVNMTNNISESMDFYAMNIKCEVGQTMAVKRKFDSTEVQIGLAEHSDDQYKSCASPKKKSTTSRDATETKTNTRSRKKRKGLQESINVKDEEENTNNNNNGENSSCCSSEEELNNNTSSISDSKANSNGKPKASRGSATDPQSLYARRRRERINERLRILQNLVPNGTKVDISTMLEEAVHYVKFLQLQIKLLSSDDLWMYAPIAYNGVDMSLYQKLSSTL